MTATELDVYRGLRNPYREAFDKYVVRRPDGPWLEWDYRSDWHFGDGFGGLAWDRHMDDVVNTYMAKEVLRERMGYAVPTTEAIEAIARLSPIVEMGAGTGYWSWMLQQAGADVTAFDISPDGDNRWVSDDHWTKVLKGTPRKLANLSYHQHTLLLCWPPYERSMAANCLRYFQGPSLVYVGEHEGGCCANDEFFSELEGKFSQVAILDIPQWPGLHDYVTIWERA